MRWKHLTLTKLYEVIVILTQMGTNQGGGTGQGTGGGGTGGGGWGGGSGTRGK